MPQVEHRPLNVDLNEIVVFARIVQLGSFSAAATHLGLPKSTVSRRVRELEGRIGARLLQRTTRKLSLTDVGRIYYDHVSRIVSELEEAELAVAELQATPKGLLRISVPLTFSIMGPILTDYLARYPDVQIDMLCTDRKVDLIEERFDLADRVGQAPDSTLVSRRVGTVRRMLLASPKFLERQVALRDPSDLAFHPAITFASEGSVWRLTSGSKSTDVPLRPRLVVNDYDMLRTVACAGFGIALLPEFLCAEELKRGRLKRVLSAWEAPELPVMALYPSTRHVSPKVVALVELLRDRLKRL